MTVMTESSSADESQQNEFLRKEIKLLKAKLIQSEQERMLAKTDWFVASQELIAQRKELEVCEQQRTQLEQRVNVQDAQLIQKREEIEAMRGEMDSLKEKLNELESKSTFMERLARLIPRQMDMDSTGPICEICDCEYNGKRIPKVLRCGHTLCIECAGRIAGAFHIRCPFDRADTPMTDGVRSLSTNFTLVEILEQRPWWAKHSKKVQSIRSTASECFDAFVFLVLISYAIYAYLLQ